MIKICIIHFNTPLLTECLIKSINKFTPDSLIYIFDNSDSLPFTYRQDNIVYIDNTKGQIINFDEWLSNFPERFNSAARRNNFASAKHSYSIQKCIELINDNFILLDSDVLLKQDISDLVDDSYLYVGDTLTWKPRVLAKSFKAATRFLPYICYLNVDMLKKEGVTFHNDNFMHGLTIANDYYDTGAYFYYTVSEKNLPFRQINYTDYVVHYKAASWVDAARQFDSYQKESPEAWLVKNKRCWNISDKVIYTCITGNYDNLLPQPLFSDYDYVCFTDNPDMKSDGIWEVRMLPDSLSHLTAVKQQRYAKLHPHILLPEYTYSIWIDANVKVLTDPSPLFDENYSVEIPTHPTRNCIYAEEKACATMKKDQEEIMLPQMDRYRAQGFPKEYGLVQTNIMFRKHNEPDCIRLMEAWWTEIEKGSHRDQLSFNYALWKNEDVRFKYLDKKTCHSEYFNWLKKHGTAIKQVSSNTLPSTRNYKWIKPTRPVSRNGRDDKMLRTFLSSN